MMFQPGKAAWPLTDLQEARLHEGRSVVGVEAAALLRLRDALDRSFCDAVELLLGVTGRVIVTGMGKSGHVARKIAATLASTGTPALFIHPGEAAHGDLGMMVAGDAVIMLSNSGGTSELRPMLDHAARLALPIIAISSGGTSTLMRAASIRLQLPAAAEACPSNIVPTTSTTMMLALGDALAMATMRERGVSRDNFGTLHPGGTIGLRLMRVSAVMHQGAAMPIVPLDMPMRDVILTMTRLTFGIAGVVDASGHLAGVVTDGDLRRHVDDLMTGIAHQVMTPHPITIEASTFAEDALTLMNDRKITALFVTDTPDDRQAVGLVTLHDLLRLGIA
ncbi:MAG TPA: KpsF/GutQ family sugar-phosphate isomerase [Sphingomonas sp.]